MTTVRSVCVCVCVYHGLCICDPGDSFGIAVRRHAANVAQASGTLLRARLGGFLEQPLNASVQERSTPRKSSVHSGRASSGNFFLSKHLQSVEHVLWTASNGCAVAQDHPERSRFVTGHHPASQGSESRHTTKRSGEVSSFTLPRRLASVDIRAEDVCRTRRALPRALHIKSILGTSLTSGISSA